MRHFSIKTSIAALCIASLTVGCSNSYDTEETAVDIPSDDNSSGKTPSNDKASSFDADAMDVILAADIREADKPRDMWRHPKEVLESFDVAPHHTILEYAPGGGWYTRILAPYVSEKGAYIAVGFPPEAAETIGAEFVERVRKGGETFSTLQSESLGIAAENLPFHFSNAIPSKLNGTVDRVLVFRMMHNLKRWGIDATEITALKATLKPDGMIGIVQHRAKDDAPADYVDGNKGYLKRDDMIAFMDEQGFELVTESNINENPNDTADYPDGVWTLPPSLGSKDEDKSKFEAIGESNRMTLLFKLKAS